MKDWKDEARALRDDLEYWRGQSAAPQWDVSRIAAALSAAYEQGVESRDERLVELIAAAEDTLEVWVPADEAGRLDAALQPFRALKSAAKDQ